MGEDCPRILGCEGKNKSYLKEFFDEVGWLQKSDVCFHAKLCKLC